MTVRLIARNFAGNRAINAPKFTGNPYRNSRILTNFGEVCYHHFCTVLLKTQLPLLLKEKTKCFPGGVVYRLFCFTNDT